MGASATKHLVRDEIAHRRLGLRSEVARPSYRRRAGQTPRSSEAVAIEGLRLSLSVISIRDSSYEQTSRFQRDCPATYIERKGFPDRIAYAIHSPMVPMTVAWHVSALNGDDAEKPGQADFSLYPTLEAAGFGFRTADERVATSLANPEEHDVSKNSCNRRRN